MRETLAPIMAARGDRTQIERKRKALLGDQAPEGDLADELAALLADEPLGFSGPELARRVRRRRQDVVETMRADARFDQVGSGAGRRWRLRAPKAAEPLWDRRGPERTPTGLSVDALTSRSDEGSSV
jgi:hypothetical protein